MKIIKKNFFCFISLSIILIYFSCTKEDELKDPTLTNQSFEILKDEVTLRKIKNLGFDTDKHSVLITDKYFLVEQDIALAKKIIKNSTAEKQTAVKANLAIDFNNINQMNYYIHSSVNQINNSNSWVNAIKDAMNSWNNISNCSINFVEVFSSQYADLIIYADNSSSVPISHKNLPSSVWARATFPENGKVGSVISINNVEPSYVTQNGRKGIMQHEIGHCLGFHHAHLGNSSDREVLCGTSLNDPNSVMRTPYNGVDFIDLDSDDIRAARLLYPNFSTLFPEIEVSFGTFHSRRGTKTVHVKITDEKNMDWINMEIHKGTSIKKISCPEIDVPMSAQFVGNYGAVKIKFLNYKGDKESTSVTFYQ